jgi:hypothetical protein
MNCVPLISAILLGLQLDRREPGALEATRAGRRSPANVASPLRSRPTPNGRAREVAGGSHRALGRDAWNDPTLEHGSQELDELEPHPGVTERQGLRAQQQHAANGWRSHVRAHAGGVASNQVLLQASHVVGADARLGERSEARIDAINPRRAIACTRNLLDGVTRGSNARGYVAIDDDAAPAARDALEVMHCQFVPEPQRRLVGWVGRGSHFAAA